MNTATWNIFERISRSFWSATTTAAACIRRSSIARRKASKLRTGSTYSHKQPRLSFLRHREIYRSDSPFRKKGGSTGPPLHRFDESPSDYSSASCSPAELTSASSDQPSMQSWGVLVKRQSANSEPCLRILSHLRCSVQ